MSGANNFVNYGNHAIYQIIEISSNKEIPASERIGASYILLRCGLYGDAVRGLRGCLASAPKDSRLHFGLALALLQGRRPHRHSVDTIRLVTSHLKAAPTSAESELLGLLIEEDRSLAWQRTRKSIPSDIMALARKVPADAAGLILDHVPAPEARTYRALHAVTRGRAQ